MRELLIVLRREFFERVRTKSFILSTALTPLFFLLLLLGPVLSQRLIGGEDRYFAIVDESGEGIGEEVATTLSMAGGGSDEYHVSVVPGTPAAVQDSLVRSVLAEELDGFIHLPADVMTSGSVAYRARSVTDMGLQRRIGQAVTDAVQGRRLASAGIDSNRSGARRLRPMAADSPRRPVHQPPPSVCEML